MTREIPDSSTTPYVARSPLDLVALAPQVLRFRPDDSVVVLTFGPVGAGFHARVELLAAPEAQEEVARMLCGAILRNRLDLAAVLIYSTDAATSRAQAEVLVACFAEAGIGLVDVLRVEKDRYFRLLEDDEDGTPYDLAAHPFTARRVFEGHVVHESRDALAESLVGVDDDEIAAVGAAAREEGDRLVDVGARGLVTGLRADALWIQGRIRRFVRTGRPLTTLEAGRMLALCSWVDLRDVAWAEMTRRDADRHVELWTDLVRRSPDDLLAAPAALLGFAAWLAGDGALAWCALDRCAAVEPDYSMAQLVGETLVRAVPPSSWEGIDAAELAVFGPEVGPGARPCVDPFVRPPRPPRRTG